MPIGASATGIIHFTTVREPLNENGLPILGRLFTRHLPEVLAVSLGICEKLERSDRRLLHGDVQPKILRLAGRGDDTSVCLAVADDACVRSHERPRTGLQVAGAQEVERARNPLVAGAGRAVGGKAERGL